MIDSFSNEGANGGDLRRAKRVRQPQRNGAITVDRLPPHAEEMERGVLGCILISPKDCLDVCVTKFKSAKVFYDLRHQIIYDALVAMQEALVPIEVISLQQWLKDRGTLEQVGRIAYLSELPDAVPSAANLAYYMDVVFDKYLLRRAITVCTESVGKIYDFEGEVPELLDGLEADMMAVNEARATTELRKMRDLMKHSIALVEDMHRGVGLIGGVRTYFGYFDKMTGGLHRKEMVVIGGRPSLGKTSLAMNIAWNVATRGDKLPVGVFSMEMSAEDICLRLWCAASEVDFHKLRTGFVSQEAMEHLTTTCKKVGDAPIYIDDQPSLSILELRAKARRMVHQFKVQLFVIDYLQLMRSTNERAKNREQEIADISSGLKAMAKELNVPVVVLCQLNREAEKRKYTKPQLSDLRESGAIEQDADLVGILYRPKQENEEDEDGDEINTNLHIAKQRNGPTGDAQFTFKRWCMRFEDAYHNLGHAAKPAGAGISKIDESVDKAMSKAASPSQGELQ